MTKPAMPLPPVPPPPAAAAAAASMATMAVAKIEEDEEHCVEMEQQQQPPQTNDEQARLLWKRKESHRPHHPRSLSPRRPPKKRSKQGNLKQEQESRSTRRSRRSGGGEGGGMSASEPTYMSLQIRYRGGNDWDPLNACWVPKQPKKPKKKTSQQQQQPLLLLQPPPPQQQQQHQKQDTEKDHHDNKNDDDNGTAITESSSSLATEQDSIQLSVHGSSTTTSLAEPTEPRDMLLQMKDSFEQEVPEETAAALTAVVVEGDDIVQEVVDGRMMMMMMVDQVTTGQKVNEDCTEASLDTKQQPIDDDDESTTSKSPLQETASHCLDPPAECTHMEEAPATWISTGSCTSSGSLAEEPSAPQVEPNQNALLNALFQAVEMAKEIPVYNNTEVESSTSRAPSLSVMDDDEDIFADAPDDEDINIPAPWRAEEDAAAKLPRSAINLFVYGPTPIHMAEVWHKMYGRRWQDHHH